ncbi:MAG: tetratricopeptide repeat protein [Janthinobacterium lividum]
MSLINKMLQDLDARGGQPGAAAGSPEIKPVLPPERPFPWLRVALIGGLAALLGGSGYLAWRIQQAAPAAAAPIALAQTPPVAPKPAPVEAEASAPAAAVVPVAAPVAAEPAAEPAPKAEPEAAAQELAPPPAPRPEAARAQAPKATLAAPAKAAPTAPVAKAARPEQGGRMETTAQRAENGYRRALASLEDGRVTEAIGHLEGALRADPRHEAARQTLVGLLIEAKRPDEAIRQLGAALALDPRQPAMAMLMARLQLERGSPGIDTLMRTLPYAAGNGEYQAFLAGALAREGRHREAAEHYGAALRTGSQNGAQNGVWWMGLGISLQAEKRIPEAVAAYQKARDSGTLAPDLLGFVDRKLKQLAQ